MTKIVAYHAGFADQVKNLIIPIQRDEFGIDISFEEQPDLADIEGFYQSGNGGFWLAVKGDAVTGSIALKDIGAGQVALRKMFVASAYRGREHGIAKLLLDHAISHAKSKSCSNIYLGTTAAFLAAHRFYEKNGFALVEAADLPKSFPRMAVDTRFYRLELV